jgi:hypothetical protein
MNALLQKFNALPRAFKWLIALGVFLIAYFAIIEPILGFAQTWERRASTLQTAIARDKELASEEGEGHAIEQSQALFGSPRTPGKNQVAPETLYRLVNSILEAHGVTDRSVNERSVPMTGDQAASLGAGAITRIILDVSFESDSLTVISVLAELERSPEVSAISRVKIDKMGQRSGAAADEASDSVRVTLAPEAWISATGSGAAAIPAGGASQ